MYSTYNEGKSVVAERFTRTLKNKIYKHMTAISKNVYFDVLDDIADEYNNTYHKTIKMKPVNVGDDSSAEYDEESTEKDPEFKVGDHARISKFKNVFAEGYTLNWSEEIFIVKKNCKKELQKTSQKELTIEKVIKKKGNKLHVKWKGYNHSFNSWIDKKDLIK